jgi:hypothetical protein
LRTEKSKGIISIQAEPVHPIGSTHRRSG